MKILLILLLFIMSFIDIQKRIVYTSTNYLLAILCLSLSNELNINALIIAYLLPLLLSLINSFKKMIGEGDLEFLCAIILYFQSDIYLIFECACLLCLIYSFFFKNQKEIPLIPFLSIAVVLFL